MAGSGKPIGNIKLGISLDDTNFGNTLDEINAKVRQAESNMKANMKAYDSAGRTYEALSQKTKDLSKVMDGQSAKVKELTKRRDAAIEQYGAESKQVANLNTQINNATAKYNAYSRQLNDTKKELVYSKTAVNDLTKEIKDNERQMNDEVKALKAAGDESGAFEAKQKGLSKQAELSKKAMDEQRKVVKLMSDEFGDSANETEDARNELNKLERQSKLADTQLTALKKSANNAGNEVKDFGNKSDKSARIMDTFKDKVKSFKSAFSFGTVFSIAQSAISSVTNGITGLVGEAVSASDSVANFKKTMNFAGFNNNEITNATDEMRKYADETVYGLEQVLNTSAQLASNGIPNYVDLTKAAGNLNAVAGGSEETFQSVAMMLTQTAGAGKLTTENWNQLADAIPGASGLLQDAMLKNGAYTGNFRDAMANGQITSDEFNQAILQLGMNDGAIKAATSTDTFAGSWDRMKAEVVSGLQKIIEAIGMENITGFINKVSEGISNSIPNIVNFVKNLMNVAKWINDNREPLTWLVGIIGGVTLAVKGLTTASTLLAIVGGTLSAPFIALGVALGALVGALVVAYTKSETFRNIVNAAFKAVWNVVKGVIDGIIACFRDLWNIMTWLWDNISKWASWVWNKFGELKNNVLNRVQELWNGVKNFFSGGISNTWNNIVNWVSNIFNKTVELKNKVFSTISNLWGSIKNTFSNGIDTVFNWFSQLPSKMVDAIKGGKNAIVDAFKSIFNGALKAIGKPVNGIIHGASWVLEKLGADKLQEWDVPQYATGTPNGGHPGGPMMVNDGRGAETIITPNGQAFIPRGRNVVLAAPKGTHVLTAEETAMLHGSSKPRYQYKKGTNFFGNLWNGVKNVAGNVGNTLKNVVGDVWDFVSDPGALASKVLNGLGVLDGLFKYPLDVGKGI